MRKEKYVDTVPLVSVIVPVYNEKPYLAEALDSVIDQTYKNLEIIVVDDGSTDGSSLICDEYAQKDARIRVIHQENQGLSNARNVGLDCMHGSLVSFLDSDDVFRCDMILNSVAALFESETDLVCCRYLMDLGGKNKVRIRKPWQNESVKVLSREEALRAMVDGEISFSVWNKLYTRDLWRNLRFPDGRVFEDIVVTYRVLERITKMVLLPDELVLYRRHPGSVSVTKSVENITDWIQARVEYNAWIQEHTPDIFTEKQCKNTFESYLKNLIVNYMSAPLVLRDKLKQHILGTAQQISLKECSLKTRGAYYLLFHCPIILRVICLIYLPLKRLIAFDAA